MVRARGKKPKDNPRFVVTNMKQSPQWLYEEVYCQRGDLENRIKELHYGMEIGRTSCTSFWANQLRVLIDRGSLRVDAGTTLRPGWHRFCACTSLHVARAFSESRSSRDRVGTSHRTALAAVVSLLT